MLQAGLMIHKLHKRKHGIKRKGKNKRDEGPKKKSKQALKRMIEHAAKQTPERKDNLTAALT